MLGAILTLCAAPLFTGCTDNIDNPVEPAEPIVDPVTQEEYENDDLMDRTVKPGDSFWQFALGTWLKNHDEEDAGLQGNLILNHCSMLSSAFMESSDPLVQKLLDEADNLGTEDYMNQLFSIMFDLDIAADSDTPPSRKQLVELLAKMVDSGYSPLVKRTINTDDGVFVRVLTSGENSAKVVEALQSGDDPVEAIKEILSMVSSFSDDPEEDDEDLDVLAQKILEIEETVGMAHNDQYADDLRLRQIATPKRDQRASQFRARRRAADGLTVEDICQALGVTDDYSVVDEQLEPIFTLLLEEDVETLASYLVFYIASQYYDLMPIDWSEYGDIFGMGSGYMNLGNGVKESLYTLLSTKAPELISRVDYMVMKDDIDIEGCRTLMEQMRTLMDGRIAANDWMSDATKGAAREKLAAMKFNIGVPDEQPGASFELIGENLLENVQQLRQQRQRQMMALVGKPVANHGWDFAMQFMTLGTYNAMYAPFLNQLFILPAFLSDGIFPKDNEPMRYATAMVFGHEMCHGFDANGSNYDAEGSIIDWWTPADRTEFEQRQQQMVTLYDQLWQYDGVHADGKMTLTENMADMGGVRLAFELYKQKLSTDGLNTEATNHQLREFFLHYVLFWQEDASADALQDQLEDDEHSANHNRIIGITRLMDEWYDLFRVTDGQWYLTPAERVRIW